jgi:hypothetical protein
MLVTFKYLLIVEMHIEIIHAGNTSKKKFAHQKYIIQRIFLYLSVICSLLQLIELVEHK